jgi:hypothetical protein
VYLFRFQIAVTVNRLRIGAQMIKLSGFLGAVGVVAAMAAAAPPGALVRSTEPGVANFLSAVNTIRDQMKQLSAEKNLSPNDFHLASLQKLINPGNAAVLAKAIEKNSHDIHELREALGRNAIVSGVLGKAGVPVDQVVALDVQHGGESTIYYQ